MPTEHNSHDDRPWADDLPYWKTGGSSPDSWLDKAAVEIERAGGQLIRRGYIEEATKASYMLEFTMDREHYRLLWPVALPKQAKDSLAARRQAATALHHAVKARCVEKRFRGSRAAFLADLVLPDGRAVLTVAAPELLAAMPKLLMHDNI